MHAVKKCLGTPLITTFTVNLLSFLASESFSWTSPVLPKFQSNDSAINPLPIPTTTIQDSIIAAILLIGGFLGILSSGFIINRLGKKKTLLISGIPFFVAQLMFAFANNVSVFIAGRLIFGLGIGLVFTSIAGYVAEIAGDSNRGFLVTFISILGCFGQLFCYAVGPYVSIKVFSFLHFIPLALFYIMFPFCPESPYEIVAKGDFKKAEKILIYLRGTNEEDIIARELITIKEAIESQGQEKGSYMDLITNKTLRKAVTITSLMVMFQQFSGLGAVLAYTQAIFDSANVSLSPSVSPIIVQSVFVASVLFGSQLIDKMGRKFWLVFSSIGIIISLGILGVYFYLNSLNYDLKPISWLPVFCLVFYFISYALGFLNVPWILMGEYFPPSHKSEASTVTMLILFGASTIVTLCFPLVTAIVGEYVIFWAFCGILIVGIFVILFVIPETKGKSFLEIQDILGGIKT